MKSIFFVMTFLTVLSQAHASRFDERARAYQQKRAEEVEQRGNQIANYFENSRAKIIAVFSKQHGGHSAIRREEDSGGYVRYYFTTGDGLECMRNFMNDDYTCYNANNDGINYPIVGFDPRQRN
jgi:hypothetical protein